MSDITGSFSNNFYGIKKTKRHRSDLGKIAFLFISGGVYRRLESIDPGCLKRDTFKHARENNPPTDCFAPLPGEVIRTRNRPIVRRAEKPKKNHRIEKQPPTKVSTGNTICL